MRIKSITTLIATVATLLTTATVSANSNAEQVLVLLSSETHMTLADGSTYETGYYLNEFGVPADKLQKAGYELVLATPKGNARPRREPGRARRTPRPVRRCPSGSRPGSIATGFDPPGPG